MRVPLQPALLVIAAVMALSSPLASAASFSFSTGGPDSRIGMASRPASGGQTETEAADDFVLDADATLTQASFTGLLSPATPLSDVQSVGVEIYRAFPLDSVNPPDGHVPTRANSPSDVAFDARTGANGLGFSASQLSASFTALNSIDSNGIHPIPNQTTGGEGAASGAEVRFDVTFAPALKLPAGHYFFVPQVGLSTTAHFLWLSAPKPIVAGTPFTPDLQAWIRNDPLAPDWLRVGTDVVGGAPAPTFNGAFSLTGTICSPIAITPDPLPDGIVGSPYAATLSGSGGDVPYSFTATGTLPSGIALVAGGTLSGTPTGAPGAFPLLVTTTDASGCIGTASRTLTIRAAAASGPPGGTPPGHPAAPRITALRISPASFPAASRGASIAARRSHRAHKRTTGTTVSYKDSRTARTTLTVLKPVRGVKQGRSCRRPGRHVHGPRCTRYAALGHVVHADAAGRNRFHFSGRIGRRKLTPGRYRLSLTPRAAGRTGATASARFRIVR